MSHVHHWAPLALLVSMVLTGCQGPAEDTPPSTDVADDSPIVETLAPEFVPERVPGGSARENQPHIDDVIAEAIENARGDVIGLELVEALVEAGYSLEDIELTPDKSLTERPADSTALALRFGEECLIAQWGSNWYASAVEPLLASDTCLLGKTVSLN